MFDGLPIALNALGLPPGRVYRGGRGRHGRSWQISDRGAGPRLMPRYAQAAGVGDLGQCALAWRTRGALATLLHDPDGEGWRTVTRAAPPLPEGTRLAAALVLANDDGTPATVFVVRDAPLFVHVEGRPNPSAMLAAISDGALQSALTRGEA